MLQLALSPRPTAVSQVLKAIHEQRPGGMASAARALSRFEVFAASGAPTRELAFRLAYTVYRKKGYVAESPDGLLAAPYDARPDTLVALALDRAHAPAGTVSLVFDASEGLPCDEIFHDELAALRREGRWLVEVARLAIADEHAGSRDLLTLLCNIPVAFAACVRGYTDLVVEVHPRHVPFYRRLLNFRIAGSQRPCPRVNGAPAVLLRADLDEIRRELQRLKLGAFPQGERSLYPQFLREEDERALADRLAGQHRPMTILEMRRFGLERPGALRAQLSLASGPIARSA